MSKINFTGMVFEEYLLEEGIKVFDTISRSGCGLGEDDDFYYMWRHDKIFIGVKKSFCKWGNSRDFVLYKPIDKIKFWPLYRACMYAKKQGNYDVGWGMEYDVASEYRRARRNKI